MALTVISEFPDEPLVANLSASVQSEHLFSCLHDVSVQLLQKNCVVSSAKCPHICSSDGIAVCHRLF